MSLDESRSVTRRESGVLEDGQSVGLRRPALIGALAGLLALDWAAVDDVFTGTDPSLWAESLVLVASVPLIGILLRRILRRGY